MAGSILFSVHAPPAIAAELPAALHIAVSPVDGKINRNVRFLPAEHAALIGVILQRSFAPPPQEFFKCQLHWASLLSDMLKGAPCAFFPRRWGNRIFLHRFAGRWQLSRHAPANIPTRPFLCCPL